MSSLMNGAKMLLECLAREGVDCFFGYPGGVTLPFYDALQLAGCLLLHSKVGEQPTFVCADRQLIKAAEDEGLTVFDPTVDV